MEIATSTVIPVTEEARQLREQLGSGELFRERDRDILRPVVDLFAQGELPDSLEEGLLDASDDPHVSAALGKARHGLDILAIQTNLTREVKGSNFCVSFRAAYQPAEVYNGAALLLASSAVIAKHMNSITLQLATEDAWRNLVRHTKNQRFGKSLVNNLQRAGVALDSGVNFALTGVEIADIFMELGDAVGAVLPFVGLARSLLQHVRSMYQTQSAAKGIIEALEVFEDKAFITSLQKRLAINYDAAEITQTFSDVALTLDEVANLLAYEGQAKSTKLLDILERLVCSSRLTERLHAATVTILVSLAKLFKITSLELLDNTLNTAFPDYVGSFKDRNDAKEMYMKTANRMESALPKMRMKMKSSKHLMGSFSRPPEAPHSGEPDETNGDSSLSFKLGLDGVSNLLGLNVDRDDDDDGDDDDNDYNVPDPIEEVHRLLSDRIILGPTTTRKDKAVKEPPKLNKAGFLGDDSSLIESALPHPSTSNFIEMSWARYAS